MAVERLIGVDFGTSTSVIRVKRYENGNPLGEKLETKEVIFGGNGAMVPTLVMRKDDDASVCYFGYEAQQKKKRFSNFHSFKMDLESSDPEKQALAKSLTEEFYRYLAKQYKSQSDGGHLGSPDDKERTIISYPVKWSEETKTFMLETARKAGFPNVTGMDEAQAAIHAVIVMSTDHLQKHSLLQNGVGANILLIDMGAGTTDLVLARYTPGDDPKTEMLNTWPKGGGIQFGGREVDSLLQTYFQRLLCDEDADTVEKIFRRVGTDKFKSWKEETVSPALLKNDSVSDFAALDERAEDEEIDLEYCLDRAAFEDCLADYLKQFPELVKGCLDNAGMRGDDVDLVIVTGGHSQWYFVHDMLAGKLPRFGNLDLPKIREDPARIISISRPQETVALGLSYCGIHMDLSAPAADSAEDCKSIFQELCCTVNAVKEQKQEQPDEPAAEAFVQSVAVPVPEEKQSFGTVPPEQLVEQFFMEYPPADLKKFSNIRHSSVDKQRVHLRVPPNEPILVVKDCTWFDSGKSGTIITPRGIYIREDFGQPDYISWPQFIVGRFVYTAGTSDIFLHDPDTGRTRKVGYFLGSDCAREALRCYEELQRQLRLNGDFSEADHTVTRARTIGSPDLNTYTLHPGRSIHGAAMAVRDFFASQNMETHYMDNDGSSLVQARAIGTWQQYLGLDKAISVRFTPVGSNQVTVEIGGGKWIDKAIGAAVSMVILWPLFVTSGVGAVEQAKLLKDARNVIESYFYSK